ncbi:MAG: TVP38/TMEM64 family protein [Chitinophagaceae bacterium]|nr:MAG: TVP38/TMEM64 family protein [Chitinophagaceae bacterium]
MQETLLNYFENHPQYAVLLSLALSILVAVLGVVPSVFITAVNILFFGFWNGTLLSLAGEAAGAAVAFYLYRVGFRQSAGKKLAKFPKLLTLVQAPDRTAFYLIFTLRLLPFVPSGLITFAAAIGKVTFLTFLISSTLGKIPALLIEASAVYGTTQVHWQVKLMLLAVALVLLLLFYRNHQSKK